MYSSKSFVLWIASLCTIPACGGSAPSSSPERPDPIAIWPAELDTNTALRSDSSIEGAAVGVGVRPSVALSLFEEMDLPLFERAVSMETWPEHTPLAGHITSAYQSGVYEIAIVPTVALEGRWYAVVLDVSETAPRYSSAGPNPEPGQAAGRVVHRFFSGSLPILRNVWLNEYGVFHFEASEPLSTPGTTYESLVRLQAGASPITCTPQSDQLTTSGYFEMQCDVDQWDRDFTMHVAEGFESASGVPLHDLAGETGEMSVEWNPAQSGGNALAHTEPSDALFALTTATAGASR